ncbi:MAG TPA: enoyl-CoA hydratase [Streptosporangiaceae bacterium]|nr:enoyl-CoA hydratase [Streptosporangiaceae bacterium]
MTEVLLDVTGHVATVTLNRPERRNALSSELLTSLRELLAEIDSRPDVRAVVLTGADPSFCAGLDLTELGQPGSRLGSRTHRNPLPDLATPLIGAVNGAAVTGGLELALACDFLIASERATFADTHARMGIQPGWGLTVALPEAVGYRRAREMSATGNFIDASTALEWGLVNHVVPHSELLGFSRKLAADVASSDQDALAVMFATYDAGSQVSRGEARRIETAAHAGFHASGIDHEKVSLRRDAVIERGRAQK